MSPLNDGPTGDHGAPSRSSILRHRVNRLTRIGTWFRSLNNRAPALRAALSAVLLIGGLLFMAHALRGQFAELATTAFAAPVWVYPALAVLGTFTTVMTAWLHSAVLASITSVPVDRARVRYAYASSQLARYLPGKVFGVILETQMLAPAFSLRQVIAATLMQTLLIYAWASAMAIVVLAALATGSARPILLAPTFLALLWIAQRNRWIDRLRYQLKFRESDNERPVIATTQSRRSALEISILLAFQWMPFFLIWFILAGPSQGIAAALWLGASYLLASMGGSFLVLVPSGLIVREAAFVWLGALSPYGLPASSLVSWAVVVRLTLTLSDLLAVPLLWVATRKGGQK